MDTLFLGISLLVFTAIFLLVSGLYQWWNSYRSKEVRRIEERLRSMSAGQHDPQTAQLLKARMLDSAPAQIKLLLGAPRIHQLEKWLLQTGVKVNASRFIVLTLSAFGCGLMLSILLPLPWPVIIITACACASLPSFWLIRRRAQRLLKIETQLPDALDMMSRALRAGHAFLNTLKMVSDEMQGPVADEFRITFDEINYGFSLQDALSSLAERVPLTDLRFFVLSVLIQKETGGNLSEVLGNISALIRARLKLLGAVRVLSAEGRLSAWILSLLPFVLAGVINFINPGFMAVLWQDPTGLKMLMGMLIMMVAGVIWMRQIIRIHV